MGHPVLIHNMTGGQGPVETHRYSVFANDEPLEVSYERGGWLVPGELAICAGCRHKTEMVWWATSETHRINRSGEPAKPDFEVGLCCHCWGELLSA